MTRAPDKPTPAEIDEIAKKEGLSARTVVRTFEKPELVRDETRQRVIRSREDLGFGRAPAATFGFVVPDDTNQFFAQLKKSLETRLAQTNFQLFSASSYGYEQREYTTIQSWIAMKVAGVFYAQNPPFVESLTRLRDAPDLSVVLVDIDPQVLDDPLPIGEGDAVLADNAAGIERAMAHLVIENGHERIAFLGGPDSASTARARARAFDKAIHDHQLDPATCPHLVGDYSYGTGRAAAIELAKRRRTSPADSPTAVVAANDLMAIGVMKGLRKMGLKVPEHFSVIGFDNIEACDWVDPELTSIDQRVDEIAERAVRLMSDRVLPGPAHTPRTKAHASLDLVAPVLVERRSVAPPSVG